MKKDSHKKRHRRHIQIQYKKASLNFQHSNVIKHWFGVFRSQDLNAIEEHVLCFPLKYEFETEGSQTKRGVSYSLNWI